MAAACRSPGAPRGGGGVWTFAGLRLARQLAGRPSLLDLKRLELAKAIAKQPDLLLLDEIAGGLTEAECDDCFDILADQ